MNTGQELSVALTIAGSDSGGGAGIQADLKTFRALDVFGASAVTCLTAQNPDGVEAVEATAPDMVAAQIRAVCEGFPVGAAKTGMLFSSEIILAVCGALRSAAVARLVVDPVMVATSGAKLLRDGAVAALCSHLIPLATVMTPNASEAEILWGHSIGTIEDLRRAASELSERFGTACVAKGGHVRSDRVVDVLCADGEETVMRGPRIEAAETHGTGCTFSAAMAALLAKGASLADAAAGAKQFVSDALQNARPAGRHSPLWV